MKSLRLTVIPAILLLGMVLAGASNASTPYPTILSSAIVDGNYAEWDLNVDFFANMYRAGDPTKPLESKLYLRYDCSTHTMYALVLAQPGIPCVADAVGSGATSWIAIDAINNKVVSSQSGDDGVAPDFAYIDVGFDGDSGHARGYEASFPLAEGTYQIVTHVNVIDGGEAQTSATEGHPHSGPELIVTCPPLPTESSTWSGVKVLFR